MSLSKVDERIARLYLALADRDDLAAKVLDEMELTRRWVLAIAGDEWPLQHRRVLGPVIRMRLPFVNVLSVTQALALRRLRTSPRSATRSPTSSSAPSPVSLRACRTRGDAGSGATPLKVSSM